MWLSCNCWRFCISSFLARSGPFAIVRRQSSAFLAKYGFSTLEKAICGSFAVDLQRFWPNMLFYLRKSDINCSTAIFAFLAKYGFSILEKAICGSFAIVGAFALSFFGQIWLLYVRKSHMWLFCRFGPNMVYVASTFLARYGFPTLEKAIFGSFAIIAKSRFLAK